MTTSNDTPSEPKGQINHDYVRELMKENQGWRRKFKAANERIVQAELRAASMKAGMVDADGYRIGDLNKVKLNDDGKVEGVDDLIEDLRKTKPFLFGKGSTGSSSSSSSSSGTGAGSTSAASDKPTAGEPQKFNSMKASPDEIQARLKDILSRRD